MNEINNYKFVVCMYGNGIDTHRIYECLILNTVPIIFSTKISLRKLGYNEGDLDDFYS